MKKKKIKLSILFVSGLSIILILLSLAYFTITAGAIKRLGRYAVNVAFGNTRDIASDLFLEITRRTAKNYSEYFDDAKDISFVIAKQIEHNFTSTNLANSSKNIKLKLYKDRDFFVNDSSDGLTACYWGNEVEVPKKVTDNIGDIAQLTPLFKSIFQRGHSYYFSIWVHGRDDYICLYPPKNFYKNIQNRNSFAKYYAPIDVLYPKKKLKDEERILLMRPYKDITGVTLLSAYSSVYGADGEILATVGVDLDLEKLLARMLTDRLLVTQAELKYHDSSKVFEGFPFIVGARGIIVVFPKEYAHLFSLPENYSELQYLSDKFKTKLSNSKNPKIKDFAKKMHEQDMGFELLNLGGENYYLGFCRIKSTDWKLGFVVNEERLIAPIKKTQIKMEKISTYIILLFIIVTVVFLIFAIIATLLFFRKYLLSPIMKMRTEIKKMGKGNFDIDIPETSVKELAELASAFSYLGKELTDYMESLKNEISAREKIETEIKIAADIQMLNLPQVGAEFEKNEFELSAKLFPAQKTSGDFYDFFYITENKIAVVIVDVSGKGLSAAFFMAMSKTLLKSICMQEKDDPSRVFTRVNKLISQDNRSYMYFTGFLFYYDLLTGKVTYANAGHHSAYLLNSNGKIKEFGLLNNLALGFMGNELYEKEERVLDFGDKIILYTDGVTDATNSAGIMYGEERFKDFLRNNHELSCDILTNKIIQEIADFEGDNQFDDITVIIFQKTM
jgi:hypothetical protein